MFFSVILEIKKQLYLTNKEKEKDRDHVTKSVSPCAGIWSAAFDGDLARVKSMVRKGTDPNQRDTSGYTALVSS